MGAGAPLPPRSQRMSPGGHWWRVRCGEGHPIEWVAADATPSRARLLEVGRGGGVETDVGYSACRERVSIKYAIAMWGSAWDSVFADRGVYMEGLDMTHRAFVGSLAGSARPSRRISELWWGVPLDPSRLQEDALHRRALRGSG